MPSARPPCCNRRSRSRVRTTAPTSSRKPRSSSRRPQRFPLVWLRRWASRLSGATQSDESSPKVSPLVVVIDDLHWADKSTVLLLRHLLDSIASSNVSVLATYRHTDLASDAPFAEALPRLRGDPTIRHILLTGLDPREVGELTG